MSDNARNYWILCDFCGQREDQVATMIATEGAAAAICTDCVEECVSIAFKRLGKLWKEKEK